MSLFGDVTRDSLSQELAESMRQRLVYVRKCQATQRKGGVAWKQWQQAINEVHGTFDHLKKDGLIDDEETLR